MPRCHRTIVPAGAALAVCLLGACTSGPYPIQPGEEHDRAGEVWVDPQAALQAGTTVEVKFLYTPELDLEQVIRADGKIALPLVGDVHVVGKTPSQVRTMLLEQFSPHLVNPSVTVIVRATLPRQVFVGGQVHKPGPYEMPARLTAAEAVLMAGGPDFRAADVGRVVVVRTTPERRVGYAIDLGAALRGEVSKPFHLRPRDMVFVPRTGISKLNQWVDQYINRVIPQFGFFYRAPLNNATIGIETPR